MYALLTTGNSLLFKLFHQFFDFLIHMQPGIFPACPILVALPCRYFVSFSWYAIEYFQQGNIRPAARFQYNGNDDTFLSLIAFYGIAEFNIDHVPGIQKMPADQ